ncbi:MAG: hypothetical protein NTY03_01200 [Candidatus Bathyarchaeota archaeon]|nr:hypothetical protein [Candidatus Bathyarchaeota archaeon]
MKVRHGLIVTLIFLTAVIAMSISSYHPKPEPITKGKVIGVGGLTWDVFTNRTSALNQGINGYILARLTKPTGLLVIPANGTTKATVELWFVSYDWENVSETRITVSPQQSYGGGEFYSFTASCEPNGNMTLRVNQPTVINVTLSVPKGQKHGVGLGYNYGAGLVNIEADYGMLDSSDNLYEPEPTLSTQPANVTDEDSVTIKIFNPGPWVVEYGDFFQVEKMVNGTWRPVAIRSVWLMYLAGLGAGGEGSQRVNVTGLDSGLYRLSKEIEYGGKKQWFYDEFNVERPMENANDLPRWGLRVEVAMADATMKFPDRPSLLLTNMGARTLYVDGSYELERLESGGWVPFYYRGSSGNSTAVGWGGVFDEAISGPVLSPGDYRLIMRIGVEGTSAVKVICLGFKR